MERSWDEEEGFRNRTEAIIMIINTYAVSKAYESVKWEDFKKDEKSK